MSIRRGRCRTLEEVLDRARVKASQAGLRREMINNIQCSIERVISADNSNTERCWQMLRNRSDDV
jgi:hypothetical protein